jgi:polyphosphate kinase
MTLIVRRERNGLRRYAHISTGNYHSATARLYEDYGFFTADEEITADVADLFNYITGFGRPQRFRKLLVAPFTLRSGLVEEIRKVAASAAAGERARIRLKINHLVDPGIVEELYAASTAGATIDVIARTTCSLRPGVEGLSDNIRVRSIVGRFLEHSRLYSFEAGEETSIFVGSADLMTRNLDHRIEILAPVENARIRQELNGVLDSAFADNTNAWELAADGRWARLSPGESEKAHSHQATMMRRALTRARRRARERGGG